MMAELNHLPAMDSQEFLRWQELLEKRTGVFLSENQKIFLMTNLAQRMRETGISDYQSYFKSLKTGVSSAVEWANLVDLLTVHETRFFRDSASLQLVQNHIQRNIDTAVKEKSTKPVNAQIWSVGCSTGEEVYSLALLMSEVETQSLKQAGREFYYGVTGVDISFPALAQAREGIFHRRKLETIPGHYFDLYFDRLPDDYLQVKNTIRHRTCFVQLNVNELSHSPKQQYDVIYCQNVLIYFQNKSREIIVEEFINRLAPGGLLVLGPGELNNFSHSLIKKVSTKHCQAYIKVDGC